MAGSAGSRAADPAAAVISLEEKITADTSTPTQLFNTEGERLLRGRRLYGAPRLARPGWYRLAADRWQEVAS
jgi:hypothetical protein